jgi:molybdopterin-binding protein
MSPPEFDIVGAAMLRADVDGTGQLTSPWHGVSAVVYGCLRLFFLVVAMFRIREAAELLGVSDDTVRRWADAGRIPTSVDNGRRVIDGADLARFAEEVAASADRPQRRTVVGESARNRFVGLVTNVVRDTVMAQVVVQAGPHRVVSLMSREAADELQLRPGVLAVASIKATNVVIEVPEQRAGRAE